MAIARSQLLKELEPGLNALFGLEYDRYDNEHAEIYETESSDPSNPLTLSCGNIASRFRKSRRCALSSSAGMDTWTERLRISVMSAPIGHAGRKTFAPGHHVFPP